MAKFVSVAKFLKNTAVAAQDGAIAHIEAGPLLSAGAIVAPVEARHASYLNLPDRDTLSGCLRRAGRA